MRAGEDRAPGRSVCSVLSRGRQDVSREKGSVTLHQTACLSVTNAGEKLSERATRQDNGRPMELYWRIQKKKKDKSDPI